MKARVNKYTLPALFRVLLLIHSLTTLDRNATLPRQSADTSPQASLEATDIVVTRSISCLDYSRKRIHKCK